MSPVSKTGVRRLGATAVLGFLTAFSAGADAEEPSTREWAVGRPPSEAEKTSAFVNAHIDGESRGSAPGRAGAGPIPLVGGLLLVSVLQLSNGDQESVVTVEDVDVSGVVYTWRFTESRAGEATREGIFRRFVRAEDLDRSMRLHTLYRTDDKADYPGYTAFSISSAAYERVRTGEALPFSVTELGRVGLFAGPAGTTLDESLSRLPGGSPFNHAVRLRGTLTAVGGDAEPFPLLLDGQRVEVPAIHLRGRFAWQEHSQEGEYWVLADRAHPLLLKTVHGNDVWQMVRVELPEEVRLAAPSDVEASLQNDCRAELPGVYFAFGTATLHSASERTLASVADVLQQHREWKLAVEGHTDNVGSDASNRALSLARAEAVRDWLVHRHGISPGSLSVEGFGAGMPRESNDTVEGRARNRRVELARACD